MFGGPNQFLKVYKLCMPNHYDFMHCNLQSNPPLAYHNFERFSTAATVVAMVDPRSVPLGQGGGARSAAAGLLLRSALQLVGLALPLGASSRSNDAWRPTAVRVEENRVVILENINLRTHFNGRSASSRGWTGGL